MRAKSKTRRGFAQGKVIERSRSRMAGKNRFAARMIRIEIGGMKPKSEPAVEEARQAGFDIDLIESNLALSPVERWRQPQLALDMALELQQARIARDARFQPPTAPPR
jgi:hypothetical protein